MSFIPHAIAGTGAAVGSVSVALFQASGEPTPLVGITGVVAVVLLYVGLARKSVPRGRSGFDLGTQSEEKGPGFFEDEKDADGNVVSVYRGPKRSFAGPLSGTPVKHESGLVTSMSTTTRTTYDLIFGTKEFDADSALGRCARQHTFKDHTLPDGKPNPKPAVVDVPASWEFITYADLKQQARALGTCLRRDFGIGKKEKMAIWASNRGFFVLCHDRVARFFHARATGVCLAYLSRG